MPNLILSFHKARQVAILRLKRIVCPTIFAHNWSENS